MATKVGYFCAYPSPAACELGMEAPGVEEGADLRCAHVPKVKTVASCAHMCCHDNSVPPSTIRSWEQATSAHRYSVLYLSLPHAPRSAECQSGGIP